MAVGLEDQKQHFVLIFVAICIHRWGESINMGTFLRKVGISKNYKFAIIIVNSLMTPLGIGIGMMMRN